MESEKEWHGIATTDEYICSAMLGHPPGHSVFNSHQKRIHDSIKYQGNIATTDSIDGPPREFFKFLLN